MAGAIERSKFTWGEKTPEDSDDDDFSSPGNLVIDSSYDGSKACKPLAVSSYHCYYYFFN